MMLPLEEHAQRGGGWVWTPVYPWSFCPLELHLLHVEQKKVAQMSPPANSCFLSVKFFSGRYIKDSALWHAVSPPITHVSQDEKRMEIPCVNCPHPKLTEHRQDVLTVPFNSGNKKVNATFCNSPWKQCESRFPLPTRLHSSPRLSIHPDGALRLLSIFNYAPIDSAITE